MAGSQRVVPDLVLRGRVVGRDGVIDDGIVAVTGAEILWIGTAGDAPADAGWPDADVVGTTILPGLIDLHCHGGGGHSFPDGDAAGSASAAAYHLAHGTTGLVASLVTAQEPDLRRALVAAADLVEEGTLLGIHIEGPFLAQSRCGVQDPASMRSPDPALLDRLLDAGRGGVVSMTYAAELPGAGALVDHLASRGVVPSLGHTDADAATAAASLARAARAAPTGRSSVTHLFNGMPPMHHRAPGAAGAGLAAAARGETVLELVADGVHLADATVAMVFELLGPGALALITDAMAAAGMPDGSYKLGSAGVQVVGGVARLADGGAIAGGTARLLDVVRRCVWHAGVDLAVAVEAASLTPARLLGVDGVRGSLVVGRRADLLAVDDDLRPMAVWTAGRRVTDPRLN